MRTLPSAAARSAGLLLLMALAASAPAAVPASAPAAVPAAARPTLDINSATAAQLVTLPGLGAAEAQRIVAGRPYLSKAELATRQVLPEGLFVQIKDRIVAIQKTGTPRTAAASRKASGP